MKTLYSIDVREIFDFWLYIFANKVLNCEETQIIGAKIITYIVLCPALPMIRAQKWKCIMGKCIFRAQILMCNKKKSDDELWYVLKLTTKQQTDFFFFFWLLKRCWWTNYLKIYTPSQLRFFIDLLFSLRYVYTQKRCDAELQQKWNYGTKPYDRWLN